jgi:hypothetical protein
LADRPYCKTNYVDFCYVLAFLAQLSYTVGQPWPKCGDRTFDIITKCFHNSSPPQNKSRVLQNLHCSYSNTRPQFLETATPNSESNRSRHSILLLGFLYWTSFSFSLLHGLSHFLATCCDNSWLVLATNPSWHPTLRSLRQLLPPKMSDPATGNDVRQISFGKGGAGTV